MVHIKISGEAAGYIVGGAGERQEVHNFTMSAIVSVVFTPISNNLARAGHGDDHLLWGGTKVFGPAVNKGYFYGSFNTGHYPLEVFERGVSSYSSNKVGIE